MMGGSQGSVKVNKFLRESLDELLKSFCVIHLCGKGNYDKSLDGREGYKQFEYASDELKDLFAACDIVVSRAGSLSISEICASGAAPILIPFPHAAANHQRINAKYLVEMGACVYLEDKDLEPNKLRETIYSLLDNPIKMNYLKQNSSYLAKFDATEKIVECIKSL